MATCPAMVERSRPIHQLLRAGLSLALPPRLFLTRAASRSRQVYLTFDDGPHPVHTPALLDVLRDLRVRATFFVLGEAAERHPELLRRMAAEGHEIGNHTFAHLPPAAHDADADAWRLDVERGAAAIQSVLGRPPRLFRPPFGKLRATQLMALWLSGRSVVLWNVDPRDYGCPDAQTLRTRFQQRPLRAGDVVLLHDVLPWAAQALPALAAATRAAGLGFGTVGESVQAGPAVKLRG